MSQISEGEARVWASALDQGCWTTADVRMDISRLRHAGWTVEPPPQPRYYVEKSVIDDGRWLVFDQPRRFVVSFSSLHPDPEAAATAEARRLNDGDYGGDA